MCSAPLDPRRCFRLPRYRIHAGRLPFYENPVGVLTNNPPFPQQMFQLNKLPVSLPRQPENTFAPGLELQSYSRGMGALGLPGDLSSASRFAKVAFTKMKLQVRRLRTRKRQPVLPHPRLRRSAAWLLRSSKRQI